MPHGGLDCRLDTLFLAHIGWDGNAFSGGLGHNLRGLFTRCGADLGDDNPGTLRRHGPRRGAANASPRTCAPLACQRVGRIDAARHKSLKYYGLLCSRS